MKPVQSCNAGGTSQEKKKVVYTTWEIKCDFDCDFKIVLWLECESAVDGGTKIASVVCVY